ncbi:unnamed protein product [Leptosia nina]|uniref:Uncharacterized protein n=1 Tax=Leptosia nina TaxID=320188 RepID=A0AAV1IU35_9NEOP
MHLQATLSLRRFRSRRNSYSNGAKSYREGATARAGRRTTPPARRGRTAELSNRLRRAPRSNAPPSGDIRAVRSFLSHDGFRAAKMNGSATTAAVNGAVGGANGSLNGIGAAPRTATLGTPSAYAYASSGSLLGRGSARPVPPPTLPKYSGSFSAGSALSSAGLRERDREGTGGSHRLASLERLALRQRIIEQSANNQVAGAAALNSSATNAGPTSATVTLTDTATVSPLLP